jgi:hypothetical protein
LFLITVVILGRSSWNHVMYGSNSHGMCLCVEKA